MLETTALTDSFESPATESAKATTLKVLAFSLNGEQFGVDIADTKEVLELSCTTKIPYAPEFILGAMNLRGEIITVINTRHFVGLAAPKRVEDPRVIVVDVTETPIGLLVDAVTGTLDVSEDRIQMPLLTLAGEAQTYLRGQVQLEDHILVLLNLRGLLQCDAISRLRGSDGSAR